MNGVYSVNEPGDYGGWPAEDDSRTVNFCPSAEEVKERKKKEKIHNIIQWTVFVLSCTVFVASMVMVILIN